PLAAGQGDRSRADRGERLDNAAVDAAVDDAEALVVLLGNLPLAGHLVGRGGEDGDPHLLHPAAGHRVQQLGNAVGHLTDKDKSRPGPRSDRALTFHHWKLLAELPASDSRSRSGIWA